MKTLNILVKIALLAALLVLISLAMQSVKTKALPEVVTIFNTSGEARDVFMKPPCLWWDEEGVHPCYDKEGKPYLDENGYPYNPYSERYHSTVKPFRALTAGHVNLSDCHAYFYGRSDDGYARFNAQGMKAYYGVWLEQWVNGILKRGLVDEFATEICP